MNKILLENEPKFKSKDFQNCFKRLTENDIISENEIEAIINIYIKSKDLYIRYTSIILLYNKNYPILKDFFEKAYKKEHYLSMKVNALRGLSHYITEDEIEKLLVKFNKLVKKREERTPYNYQEYELLLGGNALPYLYKKYSYKCIKETLEIVQRQYDKMPEAFKGHFTADENGHIVLLRPPEETDKMLTDFLSKYSEETDKMLTDFLTKYDIE